MDTKFKGKVQCCMDQLLILNPKVHRLCGAYDIWGNITGKEKGFNGNENYFILTGKETCMSIVLPSC